MIAVRNVLLSGQRGPQTDAIATSSFFTPEMRTDAAVETVYTLVVEALEGAPTSALLKAEFQIAQRTTRGVWQFAEDNFTDTKPVWQTIDAVNHAHLLPSGDWPTRLANQTFTTPVVYTRRILGGHSHRMKITPTYAGGTSPSFIMSLEAKVIY